MSTLPGPAVPAAHAVDAAAVLRQLRSDAGAGLSGSEAAARLLAHGPNALPEPPPRPWWGTLLRQFKSPLVTILLVAAVLAVVLGHHADAVVILAVVLVNALIGMLQEGRAERSMAALRRLAALRVRVRRDGTEQQVEARDLVPGDILLLAAGDAVGADARLVEAAQLQAAEAALTGESVPVFKGVATLPESTGLADRHNMVHAGTHVASGRGAAVVVATGAHSEVGRIAGLTEGTVEPRTPLELRLERFGRWLVAAALALFVAVIVLGLLRRLPLSEVLMVAISQMVSMVPEGLPVAMTIALAVGMQRMAARGAIVRRLAAIETLGSTTVICSDKTGTLTRNEMTAVEVWLPQAGAGRAVRVEGSGYAPQGRLLGEDGAELRADHDAALRELLHAALLCNDARLLPPGAARPGDAGGAGAAADAWSVQGDPTEGALLVLAAKAGLDVEALRAAAPREAELPFDADAKLMATRHGPQGGPLAWVKGAPECVLRLCRPRDAAATLDAARAAGDAMAARALRVLAFAALDEGAPFDGEAGFDALAGRARLLGLVGQIDPPREEARAAVAACRGAGIRPLMLTGDHRLTGLAIARQLGIARGGELDGDRAVDGEALERMGEEELRDELPRIAVFARVQPAQKLRIVQALQAQGEVVAMTGDGVNDAPALARADIGVAMGITGTEVAKSAAKVVITDDDFATIVGAVEQGRLVYGNLKKVILYLFATSIDEVVVLLAALAAGLPLPLAAVQILWVNIVTEGTLTVNLVLDPPDGQEMRRPPVPRDDPLVDRGMLGRLLIMGLASAAVTFGWFAWRIAGGADVELARTEAFTLTVMCQWFNMLSCRSPTRSALAMSLWRNPWLAGGLALGVGLQALVLYAPPLAAMFHSQPLPGATLLALLGLASVPLWAEEARKGLARRRARALV